MADIQEQLEPNKPEEPKLSKTPLLACALGAFAGAMVPYLITDVAYLNRFPIAMALIFSILSGAIAFALAGTAVRRGHGLFEENKVMGIIILSACGLAFGPIMIYVFTYFYFHFVRLVALGHF